MTGRAPEGATPLTAEESAGLIPTFANGNGRHARLFADLMALRLGLPQFTWGGADLNPAGPDRAAYLSALRRADRDPDDLDDLAAFARS